MKLVPCLTRREIRFTQKALDAALIPGLAFLVHEVRQILGVRAANSSSMRGKTDASLAAPRLKLDREIYCGEKRVKNVSHFGALSISSPDLFFGWSSAPVLTRGLAAKASVAGARSAGGGLVMTHLQDSYTLLYPIYGDRHVAVRALRQKSPERDLCLLRGNASWGEGISLRDLPYGASLDYCEIVDEHNLLLDAWTDTKGRWNVVCNHFCPACGDRVVRAVFRIVGAGTESTFATDASPTCWTARPNAGRVAPAIHRRPSLAESRKQNVWKAGLTIFLGATLASPIPIGLERETPNPRIHSAASPLGLLRQLLSEHSEREDARFGRENPSIDPLSSD